MSESIETSEETTVADRFLDPNLDTAALGRLIAKVPKIESSKTLEYGQENMDLEGVEELYFEAANNADAYYDAKKAFAVENVESLLAVEKKLGEAEATHKKAALLWKIGIVAGIGLSVLGGITGGTIGEILILLATVGYLAIPVGLVAGFITSRMVKSALSSYERVNSTLTEQGGRIARTYADANEAIYKKIDDIYLSSLDPSHRELVLLRREQEKQHEEHVKLQMRLEEEQRRTRAELQANTSATMRLLDLEEERERRRRGY